MAQTPNPRRRPPTLTAQAAQQTRIHYLIVGLAIAGLWLLNRDKSLLYHGVQMLAVMSVLTVLQIVLRRRAGQAPAYARLVGAKLVLVALAVGGEWLLAPETPRSNAIVAIGLVVLVTALGPILDRLATNRATRATGPTMPTSQLPAPASAHSAAHQATFSQDPRFTRKD
jgi:hypothetical protein